MELTGKAAVAANADYGWLNGKSPFLIVQDSYVDIHMEVPTVTPANEFRLNFFLRRESAIDSPLGDDDYIRVQLRRTTTPHTQVFIEKSIDNVTTTLYAPTGQTNDEGTFRIKFRPNDDKIDIYFHDGSGAVVEGTDELTLIDDTLDLTFSIGYPAFELETEDTTIRTLISDGVEVYYPDTGISYDQDVADLGKGDVKCYDTMGEASEALWMRVYSEDHDFVGDCVIENGLVRMFVDDGVNLGLKFYYWTGSAWSQPLDTIRAYQDTDAKTLTYSFFKQIVQMQRAEEIQLRVRLCDSATESDSYNTEFLITLARGKHHVMFEIDSVIPSQPIRFIYGNAAFLRWSYCGDADIEDIGDYDLSLTVTNTTLTDNFMMKFDDAGSTVIAIIGTNQKPAAGSSAFQAWTGKELSIRCVAVADFDATEIHVGLIPFADVANLFKEAESATISGGQINDFIDEFTVDSSAQYEEDVASFTWSSLELHCAVDGKQIRLKALEWTSENNYFQCGIKWKPVAQNGSSQCGTTLIFHSDRTERSGNQDQPNNGYYVVLDQDAGVAYLYKNVAGTPTLLDTASGLTFTLGTYYSITVRIHESVAGSIAVWIGGVEKLNATSEFSFEEGAIGVGNTFGTSTWDLFRVYDGPEAESSAESAVMLDAQDEYVYHSLTGITDIPVGRYLLLARVKDTAQVTDDLKMSVYNQTDSRYLNQGKTWETFDLTSSYSYHSVVFDITDDDNGDAIRFYAQKDTTSPNTIVVDYFLIVPITDGESLVQDIAHNELRTLDQGFRLTDTATFEIFAGLGFSYGGTLGGAYTDAMAVAAVEAEPTLDLTGVLTAKRIKNQLDNEGFFTGAGDDLRLYHDGTHSYIVNTEGNLILQNVGGDIQLETQDFFLDSTGKVQVRDKDDSDAVLFELDTTARTLKLGTAGDPLTVTINDVAISGDDADAIHVNVADEIYQITLKGTPVAADVMVIEDSVDSWNKKRIAISTLPAGSPSFGVPTGNIDIGDSAVEGSSGDATRADHQHQFSAPGAGYPLDIADAESDGTASTPARSDHVHKHPSGLASDAHHSRYADSEVEDIITAEIVNGQSIDNAIDSLINTHASDDNAHHEVFESSDFTTSFAAESLANLTTRTHGSLSDAPTSAHHVRYADSEAIAAVIAENPLALTNALKIGGDSIEDSAGSEMIGFTGAGYIDFLGGQGTPSNQDVLAWSSANGRWEVQAQSGGGGITGSGTANVLTKWLVGGSTIQDSIISDDGSIATVTGALIVSGALKAGNDGFDVDASGNITDCGTISGQIGAVSLCNGTFDIDASGHITDVTITAATVDTDKFIVQDGSQIKYRTGAQVLSDIGAGGIQKVSPTFPAFLQDGADWSVMHSQVLLMMPATDNDCMLRMSFRVPDEWPTGACKLKIMYWMNAAGTYSGRWRVSATEPGDSRIATGGNVLNDSTSYDFPSGNANTVYVKTIALSDVDIVPGCSLGVGFWSDASNTPALYIMEMWIEP